MKPKTVIKPTLVAKANPIWLMPETQFNDR